MKSVVEIVSVTQWARGTFRSGSRTSSPVCAMISYPAKTTNVRPIAIRIWIGGPDPLVGKIGYRLAVPVDGFIANHASPATTYASTTPTRTRVTHVLDRPVGR